MECDASRLLATGPIAAISYPGWQALGETQTGVSVGPGSQAKRT